MRHHNRLTINVVDGDPVSYKQTITGFVHPHQRVQVLIWSDDQKWYLQQEAVVGSHGAWSAECTFGYPDSAHGFSVVAIASAPLEPSPVLAIPTDVKKSRIANVTRV